MSFNIDDEKTWNNTAAISKQRAIKSFNIDDENTWAAQSNSVTPRVTSQPKSPSAVSAPVNRKVTVGEGLGNIGNDASNTIARSATNFVNNLPQMALGLGQDFVNGAFNPLGWAHGVPALGRGLVASAVDLVPSTVGLVGNLAVDAVNSYNGRQVLEHLPQERIRPMHTALEQWKEFQDTTDALSTPTVNGQIQEQLANIGYKPVNKASKYVAGNMTTSDYGNLWQGAGEFAVPLGTINKAGAAIKAANNASKVTKLTPKVTQELSVRVSPKAAVKYKEQIARMAEDRAKREVANGIQAPGKFRKFAGEMGKFGAIGATEGESAEDRLTNALGAMGVGAIAHGVSAGAKKAYNSEKGIEFRKNAADNFKQATGSWDWISRATSGIDATLNTNISNNANGLTKIRRDYLKLRMANPSIAKIISPEQFKALVEAKKLSPEEYKELFEIAKYGSRERAYNLAKQLEQKLKENETQEAETTKEQEPNLEQTNQEPETTVKTQEEADKWFKDREEFAKKLEESKKAWEEQQKSSSSKSDLSHVKSETDINTPEDIKTLENEPLKQTQNEDMKLDFANVKGQSVKHGIKSGIEFPNAKIDESKVARIEGGAAEGSTDTSWYEHKTKSKPKKLGDENMYEDYEVEGTKPTTDAELIQEIEAAKKQRDVPVIRSKVNTQQRTPAQRMFDRRHNEIKQKAWYKQLKNTKIKALNDDTKSKSMLDIIYEGQRDVKGSSPKMQSARKVEVRPNEKIKPYEGDSPAGNTLRDADTWKKVEDAKQEKGTTNEEKWIGNSDRPYNDLGLLYDKDMTHAGKTAKDISKTKFAKADRVYTSHKIKDFADDISNGNSDVANAIQEFVNDKHTFDFDNLPEDSHGRTYTKNDTFTINLNDTIVRQLGTASHETHHILFHKIAESCGKDSAEYKIYQEGLDANNAVHEFEINNPEIKRTKNEIDKLLSNKDTAKKGYNLLNNLDNGVYDKLIKYKRLLSKRENTTLEKEAGLARRGIWQFNGKDINYYYDKLKIHRRRTQRGMGKDSGNVKRGTGKVSTRRQEQGDVRNNIQENERPHGNDFLEDKESDKLIHRILDWFDDKKIKAPKFYETFKQASSEKIKNLSDFYSDVSKSAEDLLLKYHRYTPERMKGRLFKQSKTGEGIYFLQGTEKSDRIVWKEDNGSSKYVKKLDGVKQKGTAEQAIARNLQRLAKMQHADTCVSFLKEHFKEKKEGYIPVNSDLLFTGIVDGKSRAWLKTLMEGEDSIRKTFDVNDAVEWTELYKTTDGGKADIYLPKDILAETLTGEKELALDYINTYGKRGLDGKVRGYSKLAGAMLDFYNDRFKRLVLTSGSFVANNVFGNNIMLFANAESPADYIRSIGDAIKLKDEQIPPEVLESTLAKSIMQEMQGGRKYFSEKDGALNTIARLIDGDLIDVKANDLHGLKRVGAHLLNWGIARPNGVFRAISNAVGRINDGFERFSRKQAYSISLRKLSKQKMIKTAASMKGIEALAEAAKDNKILRQTVVDKVEDILGDYNNFTNIEKKFFKRVFPFYAWNRTITRHIIHLAKDDPAMAFMVMYQTFRLLNQDDGLEDYQHGSLKTKMYNQKTKSNIVWNKANMIPYNTLFQMITGEDHERIGTMSSAFTKPAEAIRGKKFFLDQELTSKDYKKVSVDGKSGYMNTKTGEFKEGEAPFKVRAGYLGRDLLEKTYPMIGSPLTKSFKDKQYDASLGGYNHGDYIGKVKTSKGYKKKYRAAKNRLDTKYKILNRVTGGWQPEHKVSKEQKEKYKNQRKRMRGY